MKQEKSRAVASLERGLRHLNSRYRFRRDVATDLGAVEMDFLDAPVAADMQPGGKGRADHAVGRNSREPLKILSLSPGSKDAARYGG